jgi:hypothetical protein
MHTPYYNPIKMMIFRLFALCFLMLCVSCMKDGPYTKSCELTTGHQPSPAAGTITYEVHSTGSVYAHSLTYYTISGPVIVEKPTLPFTISVPVEQNGKIGLQASGTAIDGSLKIRHVLVTENDTVSVEDECEG